MAGHQIRHQILLRATLLVQLLVLPPELQKHVKVRLSHVVQYRADAVLRRHLQLSRDMVLHQLLKERPVLVLQHIVVPDAAPHEHPLDPRQLPHPPQQLRVLRVVRVQVRARLRRQTAAVLAHTAPLLLLAAGVAEVGAWPAHVVDVPLEPRLAGQQLRLLQHRLDGPAGDHPPLVEGQRTEVAPAEAPSVMGDGKLYLLDGRYAVLVHGMHLPGVGQGVQGVQLLPPQRPRRRVHHQIPPLAGLHHRAAPDGIMLVVFDLRRPGIGRLVRAYRLIPRRVRPVELQLTHLVGDVRRPRYIRQLRRRCLPRQTPGDLRRGALAHAVHQQVGGCVEQDAAAHPVVPVVVVGEPPQRRLQPADNDGHIRPRLPRPVGVHDSGPVRPLAHLPSLTVQIPGPPPLCHRVVGHHRVQVPPADQHPVPGLAHGPEVLRRVPVRLGQYRHPITLALPQPSDQRGAEAGVVDISVRRHHQKVIVIPAPVDHLLPAHRQKFHSFFHVFSLPTSILSSSPLPSAGVSLPPDEVTGRRVPRPHKLKPSPWGVRGVE